MNTSILEKANQVHAEIKKVDRAIKYFVEVCEKIEGNGIDHDEALAKFFTEHRNVDFPGGKHLAAALMIDAIQDYLKKRRQALQDEFEAL